MGGGRAWLARAQRALGRRAGIPATLAQQVAEPLVYGAAMVVTAVSGALVYRQKLTAYRIVRSLVLYIYGLISLLIVLEFVRIAAFTETEIPAYFVLSITLGLMQAVLLVAAAQGIYFSPGMTYRRFLGELGRRRGHAFLFGGFSALAAAVVLLGLFVQPPAAKMAVDFVGNPVPATSVAPNLIALVVALFVFFLAYPTVLMFLGASKAADPRMKGSLYGLGFGWATVSGIYVVTESYLWVFGVDATGILYLANAVIFYFVIRNFRRAAAYAGIVELPPPPERSERGATGASASALTQSLQGKKVLYEVDPSVPFEGTLRTTLEELAWGGNAVFVFTPKASPLHDALKGATSLKFFLATSGVSYMKVDEDSSEVLVPQSDTAIFLDVADKALKAVKGRAVLVFDSVSELLLMSGIEQTYKFLKQFLEILNDPNFTGIFLFVAKAHETKDVNLLRGIFPSQFIEDAKGPRLVK